MYSSPPLGFFNTNEYNQINMKITEYIKDTRGEMEHVTWPTRKQAIVYSVAVVLVSIVTALVLGLFDYIFTRLLTLFI